MTGRSNVYRVIVQGEHIRIFAHDATDTLTVDDAAYLYERLGDILRCLPGGAEALEREKYDVNE